MYEAGLGVWIGRVIVIVAALGAIAAYLLRTIGRRNALASVQSGLGALTAGFARTRAPGEHDPICVVAVHYTLFGAEPVVVGVTNLRVLVVKGRGEMSAFPYDDEGEHLPLAEKSRLGRGFFNWRHDDKGYWPKVKPAPFTGQTWFMPPTVPGFPAQLGNLREFADRFYFQWFYD